MSPIANSRSGAHPPPTHHATGDASTSPPPGDLDAALPLPRHLLVALAGIAADLTSLRAQSVDDPQLHEPLDRIRGKLDGLVDSIYEQVATRARSVDASSGHVSVVTAAHPAAAVAVPAVNGERRSR